jgi:hypothetical protein
MIFKFAGIILFYSRAAAGGSGTDCTDVLALCLELVHKYMEVLL